MDIDALWKWASETNEIMKENEDSEELIEALYDLLDEFGVELTDAYFMEDGVVLRWI